MQLSNKELGKFLKTARENSEYSLYDVNKLCDISTAYLSMIENGSRKPSAKILKKLAPIYSLDYLDLYLKAGYLDLAKYDEKVQVQIQKAISNDYNIIDLKGLDEKDIEKLNSFADYLRSLK